jgi:hypothetical protein
MAQEWKINVEDLDKGLLNAGPALPTKAWSDKRKEYLAIYFHVSLLYQLHNKNT